MSIIQRLLQKRYHKIQAQSAPSLYGEIQKKYGSDVHEISDAIYFNDFLVSDLSSYINLHLDDDLSDIMEQFSTLFVSQNARLEQWMDQILSHLTKQQSGKIAEYLANLVHSDFDRKALVQTIKIWLKVMILQPELEYRTETFSLYNMTLVYTASRKIGNVKWQFLPSYARKIKLEYAESFQREVFKIFETIYKSQSDQKRLSLSFTDMVTLASSLASIAYGLISDAQKAHCALQDRSASIPELKVALPPRVWSPSIGSQPQISQAALELLKRDQERSSYIRQRTQQSPEPKTIDPRIQALIAQEQLVLNQLNQHFLAEIKNLRAQMRTTRHDFQSEVRQIDLDNPYRNTMLAVYDPQALIDQIAHLQRIYNDPFFGKVVLKSVETSEERVYYIGKEQFSLGDIEILSVWSELGKAFRQNDSIYFIHDQAYSLMYKYKFIIQDHKITGVKDESPQ